MNKRPTLDNTSALGMLGILWSRVGVESMEKRRSKPLGLCEIMKSCCISINGCVVKGGQLVENKIGAADI